MFARTHLTRTRHPMSTSTYLVLQLYRGLIPPLIGSTLFRSIQFTAYGFAYGAGKNSSFLSTEIAGTGGVQVRVVAAGIFASTCRAMLESPLEFIKVRRQTGQTWMASGSVKEAIRAPANELSNLYSGFGVTWLRTVGLMTSFFVMVDSLERHRPDIVAIPFWGGFIKGGVCATIGWMIVWPFENVGHNCTSCKWEFPPLVICCIDSSSAALRS